MIVYFLIFERDSTFTRTQNLSFTGGDHAVFSREGESSCVHDWSAGLASKFFGRSSHHFGRTLSIDRLLFGDLQVFSNNV